MIKLVIPSAEYLPSYSEAYDEFIENKIDRYHVTNPYETDIIKKYDEYRKELNLKPGYVGADTYWLVDEDKKYFIGEISIRHALTEALKRYGGHIGYFVRYSEWNKGYGSLMLKLALEEAKKILKDDEILITCDDDNIGSAMVMEHNGFVLKDKIENNIDGKDIITRRYVLKIER